MIDFLFGNSFYSWPSVWPWSSDRPCDPEELKSYEISVSVRRLRPFERSYIAFGNSKVPLEGEVLKTDSTDATDLELTSAAKSGIEAEINKLV